MKLFRTLQASSCNRIRTLCSYKAPPPPELKKAPCCCNGHTSGYNSTNGYHTNGDVAVVVFGTIPVPEYYAEFVEEYFLVEPTKAPMMLKHISETCLPKHTTKPVPPPAESNNGQKIRHKKKKSGLVYPTVDESREEFEPEDIRQRSRGKKRKQGRKMKDGLELAAEHQLAVKRGKSAREDGNRRKYRDPLPKKYNGPMESLADLPETPDTPSQSDLRALPAKKHKRRVGTTYRLDPDQVAMLRCHALEPVRLETLQAS